MKVGYEDLLQKVGGFGMYQKRIMLLIALPQILNAITSFIPNFILGEHKHRCRIPGTDNDTFSVHYGADYNVTKCTYIYNSTTQSCSSWVYDQSVYTETLISTFDMVCDQKFYRSHLVLAHHLGTFFGSFVGSFCADILGRKPTICIGGFLLFASNIALPWSQNIYLVAFLRFMNGFSSVMQYITGFILATEMVVPSKRMLVAFCVSGFYTIGLYVMDLVAYFVRDWHDLVLYTSIPISAYLFYWFLLPESPRWLVAKGKSDRAVIVLNKMSEVNKADVLFDIQSIDVCVEKEKSSFHRSLRTVFSSKTLLLRVSVLAFNWAAVDLTYYGITMNVGKLGGDVFINFLVAITVGLVGEGIGFLTSNKIGRKKVHMAFMVTGGVACLSTIFTSLYGKNSLHGLTIALAMVGKLTSSGAYLVIYLYTVELAPTVLRGFIISTCSCVGRLGSMSSSYIGDLGLLIDTKFGRALPLIIFGCVGTAAGLLCIFLPETKDKALPETTNDAEKLGRDLEKSTDSEATEDLMDKLKDVKKNEVQLEEI